jgi:hypothetical protein
VEPTFTRQTTRSHPGASAIALALAVAPALGCGETTVSIMDRGTSAAGRSGAALGGMGGSTSAGGTGAGGAVDACPEDPNSTDPCPCGVGAPAVDLCLLHHYPFDGTGTTATDVVGGADGTVVNTTLSDGTVVLAGGTSDQYVELPAGLVSAWPNVTVEVWTTWNGGAVWQRLLDFGSSDAGTGMQGMGETYLFISPRDVDGVLKAAFSLAGPGAETLVKSSERLPSETLQHVAVVVDSTASLLSLYLGGTLVASSGPLNGAFQDLNDENSWLGHSQFALDVEYAGILHDVRIFSTARTADQIAASFAAGPDKLPTE